MARQARGKKAKREMTYDEYEVDEYYVYHPAGIYDNINKNVDGYKNSGLDVSGLLNNVFLSDFKIICANNKVIRAHKIVLAMSSPVFKRMLENEFQESVEGQIKITDFTYEVVLEMATFLYTGHTSKMKDLAIELLKISEKYELPKLKWTSQCSVIQMLSVNTAADLFQLAYTYGAAALEEKAIQFIKSHFSGVRNISAYMTLSKELLIKLCDSAMHYEPARKN